MRMILLVICFILLIWHSQCITKQPQSISSNVLKPQYKNSFITQSQKIPIDEADRNGDIFHSVGDYAILGQPITDLDAVDANMNHLKSTTLDKQKEYLINYLKSPLAERHLEDVKVKSTQIPIPIHKGKMEGTDDDVKHFFNPDQLKQLDNHFISSTTVQNDTASTNSAQHHRSNNHHESQPSQHHSKHSDELLQQQQTNIQTSSSSLLKKKPAEIRQLSYKEKETQKSLLETELNILPSEKEPQLLAKALTEVKKEKEKQKQSQTQSQNQNQNQNQTQTQSQPQNKNPSQTQNQTQSQNQNQTSTKAKTRGIAKASNLDQFKSFRDLTTVGIMFLIVSFLIALIWITRYIITYKMQQNFKETLHGILRDVIALYLIITTLRCLHWLGFLDKLEQQVNIHSISVGFLVFSISWLSVGIYNIFRNHSIVKQWNECEAQRDTRDDLFRLFEVAVVEKGDEEAAKALKEQIEYHLMRQEFISPCFLPVIGDSFLRNDFPFNEYLAKALSKSSDQMFRYTMVSLLITMLISSVFYAILLLEVETQWMIISMMPIIIYFILYIMGMKLKDVKKALTQSVEGPYEFKFMKFESKRQPIESQENMIQPSYLKGSNLDPIDPRSELKASNRQQALFWYNQPTFMARFLHICLIFQLLFIVVLLLRYAVTIDTPKEYITLVLSGIFTIINLFKKMPENLERYCVCTHIQMLKDRKLVEEVVDQSKERKNKLFIKLYRVIKLLYRANQNSQLASTRSVIITQVQNYFKAIKAQGDFAPMSELNKLAHYCGHNIDKDELLALGKVSLSDEFEDQFSFQNFQCALENQIDEARQDRFCLVRDTLKAVVNREDDLIGQAQFKQLINRPNVFTDKEIIQIMNEVRYLPFKDMEIRIDVLARFIRDQVEGLPF